jgi:hypothetical protein
MPMKNKLNYFNDGYTVNGYTVNGSTLYSWTSVILQNVVYSGFFYQIICQIHFSNSVWSCQDSWDTFHAVISQTVVGKTQGF